mmetsp:Transcript_38953/g.71401  ORF Transcript_38953/g.71401 Transcript_38953/m.71401 type:complete len:1095 (+) Transcript_38953:195-3479(+)|eukprot:CAMPEP_0202026944 /NCGR_PEP_ID=MMETSP0905-20130828/60167_1 /ASSEMBLY_ACC=CAM_ASM_000554 /TAXON_ID=420261 /ORGANISM="Thalassiosira antarctica, Strain CCMP982" /LENGTH=1094 /DNA_ID=CAMNT_0048590305 /DNA_START=124 /DNA_END=3408 /DNA_ORIENTATION=-
MPPRRTSWKTSSQRRSRSGAKGNNNIVGINNIAVSQYAKQLNPYKLSSSLRGSHHDSLTRGVSDDILGIVDDDLDLGDDEDDDLGLDNILSSLVGINDNKGDIQAPSSGGANKKSDDLGVNDFSMIEPSAPSSVVGDVIDEKKEMFVMPPNRPHISQVNFGNEIAHRRETPPIQNTSNLDEGNVSPVSEEDNDTLWSDGDATKAHNMMVQNGQGPAFSSGGFEDTTRLESMPMTGPSFQTGARRGSSLVDSIIDDIEMRDNDASLQSSGQEPNSPLTITNGAASLTPPRGRFSSNRHAQSRTLKPDPTANQPRDAPQSSKKFSDRNIPPSKVTTTQKLNCEMHYNREDETLSTVTDPTESPVIYTYKKPSDDDSVSQITSSLAGNSRSSFGSSHLQNIPTNFGSSSRNRSGANSLSWMGNGAGGGGGGGGISRSRMINRKGGMVIPGPYGRDRGRISSKFSSNPPGGGRISLGSSHSGSGSAGSASLDGGQSNLDEIAYALNADCTRGRNQRTRRPPPVRESAPFLGNSREIADDLSTVESGRAVHDYIDTNAKSNVSRLGMGGVSCGAQSVSEATAVSEQSTSSTLGSTLGLFQSLAMFAWKAQHHAGRFFFPTSHAVTRRKKFDRSDSMDDLEDILLEEGANTLPHRKQRGIRLDDDDDEDEIDYFSMAMSASTNSHGGVSRKSKQRKKYFWNGRTARFGGLFLLLTVAFTVYRRPGKANKGELRAGSEGRFYDTIQRKRNQVLDYNTDALVDSNTYLNGQAGIAGVGRLGQPVEQNLVASDSDSLASADQQHFLVSGNIQLPSIFEAMANVDDLLFQRGIEIPFYWHVPRSGGGTMNDVLGSCLHLTLAADAGGSDGNGQEETLKVLHFSRQVSYVNVDTSTHQGIARAKNLNLVSSGLADVVISPLLHDASTLFTPTRRGRMFTIFRHPVERAASLFYFIQETQWKQPSTRNDQFADITIDQFYRNGFAENNWMTRFLTNELTKGELTENDLDIAKEIIRQKCLVGLLEEKGETFERIQKYFGWRPKNEEEQDCLEKKLEWAWPMKHKHPTIEDGSRAWQLILAANKFDLRLYEFAKELFSQQGEQLFPR